MEKTLGTRIFELRTQKGYTLRELAEMADTNQTTVHNYEIGVTKNPKLKTLQNIAKALGTDVDYLRNGKKSVTNDQINKMPPRIIYVTDEKSKNKIALVPITAQAGYLRSYNEDKFIRELPLYDIPNLNHGTFRMFTVDGDSMEPLFKKDDILICEYVEHWSDIKDQGIYVIVSKDGICVKKVVNNLEKKKTLIILSENPEYNPDSIHMDDILEVWRYVSIIRKGLPI